jgi:hypothetical protein
MKHCCGAFPCAAVWWSIAYSLVKVHGAKTAFRLTRAGDFPRMDAGGALAGSVFPVHGYILPHDNRDCKRNFAFFATLCKLHIDWQEGILSFV